MKSSVSWILAPALLMACDRPEVADEPVPNPDPTVLKAKSKAALKRVEVVFSDDPSHLEKAPPAKPPIVYAPGDSFQGMWNYNRRNFSIHLDVVSVDPAKREITVTLKSSDLDNVPKEFRGTVGDDGRQLYLQGVAGTGGDYESVSGFDVRDLLRKSSTQKVNLTDCSARKLRGTTGDGTNIYFWTKVKPKS